MPPVTPTSFRSTRSTLEDSPIDFDPLRNGYSSSESEIDSDWDEDEADKVYNKNLALQEHFVKELGDIAETQAYRNVAVLLLSWEKTDEDVLDVSEEVKDLGQVFRDTYNYKVYSHQLRLPKDSSKAAALQLNKFLSEFLLEEDNAKTLLVVYYGGHGISNSRGRLALVGGDPHGRSKHATRVLWSKAEQQLRDLNSDVLVIFDCCHAGALMREPESRAPRTSKTIFEYIGSSQHNMKARGPSQESFTRALIHALKTLATRFPNGFDTDLLLSEVRKAPHFRDLDQEPVLGGRTFKPTSRRLQLAPLALKMSSRTLSSDELQKVISADEASKFSLNLQLRFGSCPNKSQIADLARRFRDFRRECDIDLQRVCWNGLSNDDIKITRFPDVAWQMLYKTRRQTLLKNLKFRQSGTEENGTDDPSRDDTPEKDFDHILSHRASTATGKRSRMSIGAEDGQPSKKQIKLDNAQDE